MLHWQSIAEWYREHVVFALSYKGNQYFIYDCLQPSNAHTALDAWPIIFDTPLTIIFKIVQVACHYHLAFNGYHHLHYA